MTCRGCDSPIPPNRKWCSEACRSRFRRSGGAPSVSLGDVGQLIEQAGLDLGDVTVRSLRVSQRMDGSASVGASLVVNQDGPAWPVVQQAAPTVIKPHKHGADSTRNANGWRTAVVLPDPQIGFRQLSDGSLDPFHDERAMDVALQIVAEVKPDKIVNAGDLLDLPAQSRYAQRPEWQHTTQHAIDRAHRFLAQQRATVPNAEIELMEGNHDKRLPDFILRNAMASFGLRRANLPDDWPVMTVPFLLRLDELEVKYVDGYPAAESWINDRLVVRHAPKKMNSSGSSAARSIEDERVSSLFAHIHRLEMTHRTRPKRGGFAQTLAASVGCLCRIDGAVPGYNSATDSFGRPLLTYPDNWQNGCAVVHYQQGDAPFTVDLIPIIKGWAYYQGREFSS